MGAVLIVTAPLVRWWRLQPRSCRGTGGAAGRCAAVLAEGFSTPPPAPAGWARPHLTCGTPGSCGRGRRRPLGRQQVRLVHQVTRHTRCLRGFHRDRAAGVPGVVGVSRLIWAPLCAPRGTPQVARLEVPMLTKARAALGSSAMGCDTPRWGVFTATTVSLEVRRTPRGLRGALGKPVNRPSGPRGRRQGRRKCHGRMSAKVCVC